jgi:putative lipoic acid-binding regulatory protein
MQDQKELIEFPCHITIKVIGSNSDLFIQDVNSILLNFYEKKACDISSRSSKNDKYIALSVRVLAKSREQIDSVFGALSKSVHVKMVL